MSFSGHCDKEPSQRDIFEALMQAGHTKVDQLNFKGTGSIADKIIKEGAKELSRSKGQERDGMASAAQSVAARRHGADPPEAVRIVEEEVRERYGLGTTDELAEAVLQAAGERTGRQPEEKRPSGVLGLLRAAEQELESREARSRGGNERGGLAAGVQSAVDRMSQGGHPALAENVAEKMREEKKEGA